MIDNISGGRLIAGFVVGGGPEYYSFSINPAFAREKFQEAHDVILKAWTEDGPTEFIGKHYRLRFLNTWPKPVQQPHPEIWIPGAGSLETLEFVARHRYAYMGIPYFHISVFERQFRLFRQACQNEGYTYDPKQAGWLAPIYVADSDKEAREQYEDHWWYFVRRLLPGIEISPPGYTSLRSVENILKGRSTFASSLTTWDEVVDGQYAIVGSPDTVYELLVDNIKRLGVGNLLGLFQLGTLPHDLTNRNLELFSEEVMPRLRERFPEGRPVLAEGPPPPSPVPASEAANAAAAAAKATR